MEKSDNRFTQKIYALLHKYNSLEGVKPEIAVFCIYIVIIVTVMIFHEPWFDEAQAWLIARDAPLRDIFLTLPHYEGHPPLWHLLLMLPARLGLPYEPSIKAVQLVFAAAVVFLVEFRSPFPRTVKTVLPFTYFFLYQYGVISRPYAMLGTALFLAAIFYKGRQEKPLRFIFSLMFLCLCSAYGIVLAGGITICWLLEILMEKKPGGFFTAVFADKRRLAGLLCLLVFGLALAAEIFPAADSYGLVKDADAYPAPIVFLLCLFMIPSEVVFTSFSINVSINIQAYPLSEIIAAGMVSLLIWLFVIIICRKVGKLKFLLPYVLLSVVCSVYMSAHHIGVFLYYLLFVLWICADEGKPLTISLPPRYKSHATAFAMFAALITAAVQLFQSGSACVLDIAYPYYYSREAARVLQSLEGKGYSIMASWKIDIQTGVPNTEYTAEVASINPYLDRDFFYNMPVSYVFHRAADETESLARYAEWAEKGVPDVFVGNTKALNSYLDYIGSDESYKPLCLSESRHIWKSVGSLTALTISVRSDLYEEIEKLTE